MKVIDFVRACGLENFSKSYTDMNGKKMPFPNLEELPNMEVITSKVNFVNKTAEIRVYTIANDEL